MTVDPVWTTAGLWAAVIGSGLYHGVNPGMGWPLAVSAGLMGKGRRDLLAALAPITLGHFLAMAGVLLPFAAMAALVTWQRQISLGVGLLVVLTGVYLLARPRHPRFVARIPPSRLAFWSAAVAVAHGAGLMLVPIYLGLCGAGNAGAAHQAGAALLSGSVHTALAVSVLHTLAMIASGGVIALAVHEWLGVGFISRSWFNLDRVWAVSLIAVGLASVLAPVVRGWGLET